MEMNTRRNYFQKFATMMAALTGRRCSPHRSEATRQPRPEAGAGERPRRASHIHNGIYSLRHRFQRRLREGGSHHRDRPV